ncbi:response regulator transcription factor [Deefgea sp. CFH1-16]|uniref:response regulator transcription factor n=1 Tax=Deefgea sp. CFH1-16 TaxID=2675457 RepID=UPI0015F6520B|nr:response regulator [Deefgea sp. CFH1-16]MBM5573317.1 response regulator [Deefgea sp. CFH1-16]
MPYTMLIVDDSRVSRMMIRSFAIAQRPDWVYLEAGSGLDAIEMAKTHKIDFVSMDLNMPGIDGIEAGTTIKALQPDCFIALLTANVQNSTQERALSAGLHFVPKPIVADTLLKVFTIAGA